MAELELTIGNKRYVRATALPEGEVVVKDEPFIGVRTSGMVSHLCFPSTEIRMTGDLYKKKDFLIVGEKYTITFMGKKPMNHDQSKFRYEYKITTNC